MVSSDDEMISEIRGEFGLYNIQEMPDDVLEQKLEEAKSGITRELKHRLDDVDSLNFYELECATEAVKEHFKIQTKADINGIRGPPKKVNEIRRADFKDQDMNYWRDRMIKNIRRVCNDE